MELDKCLVVLALLKLEDLRKYDEYKVRVLLFFAFSVILANLCSFRI